MTEDTWNQLTEEASSDELTVLRRQYQALLEDFEDTIRQVIVDINDDHPVRCTYRESLKATEKALLLMANKYGLSPIGYYASK